MKKKYQNPPCGRCRIPKNWGGKYLKNQVRSHKVLNKIKSHDPSGSKFQKPYSRG